MGVSADPQIITRNTPEMCAHIEPADLSLTDRQVICGELRWLSDHHDATHTLVAYLQNGGKSLEGKDYFAICDFGQYVRPGNNVKIGVSRYGISAIVGSPGAEDIWAHVLPQHVLGKVDMSDFRERVEARLREIVAQVSSVPGLEHASLPGRR